MQNDGSISPVKQIFRNKWVRIVLIIDVVILFVIIGVIIWDSTKNTTINFNVTPVDAKIQIDGQGEYSNGSYQIHPGHHTITINHDGFAAKSFTMDLQSDYDTTLVTFLSNGTDFSFYTIKDNFSSFQKLVDIASKGNNITTDQDYSAESFISDFQHKLSISKVLPIKGYVHGALGVSASTAGFAIREGGNNSECEKIACLLVNYYGKGYEEEVMKKIKETGYDPADYQIVYERYKN